MKNRAPGTDNINAELIQTDVKKILQITELMQSRRKVLICQINNKEDKSECYKCRGIPVVTVIHKILADSINNRLVQYAGHLTGEYQNGFRNNKATINNIYYVSDN
jgi:hypothetical protein